MNAPYRTPLQRVLTEEGRRQTWLADKVGIDKAHLSRIVNGLHVGDDDLKARIAETLGRTVDELFPPLSGAAK